MKSAIGITTAALFGALAMILFVGCGMKGFRTGGYHSHYPSPVLIQPATTDFTYCTGERVSGRICF